MGVCRIAAVGLALLFALFTTDCSPLVDNRYSILISQNDEKNYTLEEPNYIEKNYTFGERVDGKKNQTIIEK